VILGQGFGAQMRAMFEKDLGASNAITREDWERRPLGDHLRETLARMWQRLL